MSLDLRSNQCSIVLHLTVEDMTYYCSRITCMRRNIMYIRQLTCIRLSPPVSRQWALVSNAQLAQVGQGDLDLVWVCD